MKSQSAVDHTHSRPRPVGRRASCQECKQPRARNEQDGQQPRDLLAERAAEVIDWLSERHGLAFSVVADFDYPGHSRRRMHGLPSRSGAELIDALRSACEAQAIDIVCERRAVSLHFDGTAVRDIAQKAGVAGFTGGYQGILRDAKSGALIGASESRLDGCALGF